MDWKIPAGIIAVMLLFGCFLTGPSQPGPGEKDTKEDAIDACRALCKSALQQGIDLSDGPCLSTENPEWKIIGWVCDVAHDPREDVDNETKNQCPEFGKTVSRFVEVTPQCTLIRTYGS